jgi:1,4-dihydroxy-2-naphthoate octaprenyltransferase
MHNLKYLVGPMRLPFVVLTPACVVLGISTAFWQQGGVNYFYAVLAMVGAIAAHISVNAFNEYFDYKSGVDEKTVRTPFSGGSGTLQARPDLAGTAFTTAATALAITGAAGIFFLYVRGAALFPLGILGVVIILLYTPVIAYNSLFCLIAPGLGFGPLMVMGTHFVLTGTYTSAAAVASLVPFFLVSNLLLLNQFPDVDADKSVGRRNFPVMIGRRGSSLIYSTFLILTYSSIVLGSGFGFLPRYCLLGLATLIIALPAMAGAYRFADNPDGKLVPFMGMNVIINLVTPVLVAVGLFIG